MNRQKNILRLCEKYAEQSKQQDRIIHSYVTAFTIQHYKKKRQRH